MSDRIYEGAIRDEIAQATGDSKILLGNFSSELFTSIGQGLLKDGHVRLHQFGSFKLVWAKQRRGRHPATGEPLIIPAQPRVTFVPAKALKDRVTETTHPPQVSAHQVKPTPVKTEPEPTHIEALPVEVPISVVSPTEVEQTNRQQAPVVTSFADIDIDTAVDIKPVIADQNELEALPDQQLQDTDSDTRHQTKPHHIKLRAIAAAVILSLAVGIYLSADKQAPNNNLLSAGLTGALDGSKLTSIDASQIPVLVDNKAVDKKAAPETLAPAPSSGAMASHSTTLTKPVPIKPVAAKIFFQAKKHKLRDGDSLWRLSRKSYTNPFFWPHIYQANQSKIRNPNKLLSGRVITLPNLIGEPDKLTAEDRRQIAEGYFLIYRYYKKHQKPFPYFALLGASKFDPAVIKDHIYEIAEEDWQNLQLASN